YCSRATPSLTLFPYTTLFRSEVSVCQRFLELELTRFRRCLRARASHPHSTDSAEQLAQSGGELLQFGARVVSGRNGRDELGELRSEEHTSELQSRENLVCRLL